MFRTHTSPTEQATAPTTLAQREAAEREAVATAWAWTDEVREPVRLDASKQYPVLASLAMMATVCAIASFLMSLHNAQTSIMDAQFVDAMDRLGAPVVAVTDGIGWAGIATIAFSILAVSLLTLAVVRVVASVRSTPAREREVLGKAGLR